MATLTAANSVIMLIVPGLFPVPQQLQGYAADDVMTMESYQPVEVLMGVDGHLSGGWVPVEKRMTISLQADSASVTIFEAWNAAQQSIREVYTADALITLPSISKLYTCTRGFLTGYPPSPDVRRILQPRRFQITWESILSAPI
jgi:hypothetical protein